MTFRLSDRLSANVVDDLDDLAGPHETEPSLGLPPRHDDDTGRTRDFGRAQTFARPHQQRQAVGVQQIDPPEIHRDGRSDFFCDRGQHRCQGFQSRRRHDTNGLNDEYTLMMETTNKKLCLFRRPIHAGKIASSIVDDHALRVPPKVDQMPDERFAISRSGKTTL
jgi:hypothetical protein